MTLDEVPIIICHASQSIKVRLSMEISFDLKPLWMINTGVRASETLLLYGFHWLFIQQQSIWLEFADVVCADRQTLLTDLVSMESDLLFVHSV